MIVEGAIASKAAIENHKRKINRVYIDSNKKTKDFNYIRKIVKDNNIELVEKNRDELNTIAIGKTHGGVCLDCEIREYDILTDGDIFYLDGIEDPFNLGYIMRNLYAFGIKNIILPKRDYTNMEAQLLKSSAGAFDMLNICLISDPINCLKSYKDNGYTLYALKRGTDASDIFDTTFSKKALFMIGGEKRGIASSILELADKYLYISYGSNFRNALNASNACAVVSTLLFAQRRK